MEKQRKKIVQLESRQETLEKELEAQRRVIQQHQSEKRLWESKPVTPDLAIPDNSYTRVEPLGYTHTNLGIPLSHSRWNGSYPNINKDRLTKDYRLVLQRVWYHYKRVTKNDLPYFKVDLQPFLTPFLRHNLAAHVLGPRSDPARAPVVG